MEDVNILVGKILVIEGIIVHLIVLYFVVHFFRLRFKYPAFTAYSNTFSILSFGILILNIGASTTMLDNATRDIQGMDIRDLILEPFIYISTYTIFIGLWILGHYYLLNTIIKIPSQRRPQFNVSRRLLYSLLILLILSIPTALGILSSNWFDRAQYIIVEALFILISQLSLLTFLFFRRALLKEQKVNISSLTKARLELIASSAKYQVAISISIFFGALGALLIPDSYDMYIEIILFNFIHIFSIFTCIKFYQAFHLPVKIRTKYGLTENRYEEFSKGLSEISE